jgi:hypothetical protein
MGLLRTDVSEERVSTIIKVTRFGDINIVSNNYQPKHPLRKSYVRMEALIWNTRLRMDMGVGVAGNGVGLLSGWSSRPSRTQYRPRTPH